MSALPEHREQILRVHAELIHRVVAATLDPARRPALEPVLRASAQNGWSALVSAILGILDGHRHEGLLAGLDEEDRVIASAILEGLQNPSSLPARHDGADPGAAAPGLALMIHNAAHGDARALALLGDMAGAMRRADGDMARLGAILKRMLDGERDPDVLRRGLGGHAEKLMLGILDELARLGPH